MFIERIVEARRDRLATEKQIVADGRMKVLARRATHGGPRPSFRNALTNPGLGLIGEIKKASPSRGVIREDFDPAALALQYRQVVDAVSVLTEETFFQGGPEHLEQAVAACPDMCFLRKDFIIDAYQIDQARVLGASAVLLIAAILDTATLRSFREVAGELGMEALVEVHREEELDRALASGARIVGINNRNLSDFSVSLETTLRLAPLIPEGITVVSESGFSSGADTRKICPAGIDAILVGESFMRSSDVGSLARELRDGCNG